MIKKNNRLKRKNHVQDKTTFATRIKARIGSMKRFYELDAVDDVEEDEDKDDDKPRKCDPAWMISTVKSCHYDEESLKEYINRTREMFLLQYSLSVKEETMQKMDAIAAKEEENLNQANTHLEESAVAFEEFLKENDKFSVDAVKIAEQETKDKLEKMIEMKKATAQMMNVKRLDSAEKY
nr:PREDICTED: coiled-coil domain-containing protein 37-like [Latimeria chalumnae]|eukprot:XP_014339340.1 PREDICTED: coiled-coil domain-containing protein 37-like [Latimeria chalumnae]